MFNVVLPVIEESDLEPKQFDAGIKEFLKSYRYSDFYTFCIVPEDMDSVYKTLLDADPDELASNYIEMWDIVEHWTVGELLANVTVYS